jgi:uncharacterized protein (AIM24 family)
MSKIALSGNASGTGVLTIAAPNTNSDRTLTLPDESGTVLTSASAVAASQITSALNATGSAPIYACRAWVNFNGTGTVAIRASGNVSSITDNGTGQYTVNFSTSIPDTNYSVTLGARPASSGTNGRSLIGATTYSTSAVQIQFINAADTAYLDPDVYCVAIFR